MNQLFGGVRKTSAVFRQKTGGFVSCFRIENITEGVDDDDGSHLQISDLSAVKAETGLYGAFHAVQLACCGAGAGADVSLTPVGGLQRAAAGEISPGCVRPVEGLP